jgi:hypothetical protein
MFYHNVKSVSYCMNIECTSYNTAFSQVVPSWKYCATVKLYSFKWCSFVTRCTHNLDMLICWNVMKRVVQYIKSLIPWSKPVTTNLAYTRQRGCLTLKKSHIINHYIFQYTALLLYFFTCFGMAVTSSGHTFQVDLWPCSCILLLKYTR